MLADQGHLHASAGALDCAIHLPGEWLGALIGFIASALPAWRDDPVREKVEGETRLTAQLCARLNSLTRHSQGWDFIQFRREEPDEIAGNRSIDLAVSASGSVIWIEGHEYTEYRTLLPIECKRLPTPAGKDRDEREYLFSRFSSTGGVQRFKSGHHGGNSIRAAMIGYVQSDDLALWKSRVNEWIDGFVVDAIEGWAESDKFRTVAIDTSTGVAHLTSSHDRVHALMPIALDHIWLLM